MTPRLPELVDPPVECSRHCGWEWPATADADRRRAVHEHAHHGEPLPPQPVTGANWQEQAADAIRQVAARGQNFTFYAALSEFGLADPPNAKSCIGRLATLLHDLRDCHPVGYAPSERKGTKSSAAKVWNRDGRRCEDVRCRQRAGVA